MCINYDNDPDFVWKRVEKEGKAKDGKTDDGKAKGGKPKATNDKGKAAAGQKRKRDETEPDNVNKMDIVRPAPKKRKTRTHLQMFRGHKWNPRTQSCAYDSILSIFSNVYWHNAQCWRESMGGVSGLLAGGVQEWAKALQYAAFEKMEEVQDALQATSGKSLPANSRFWRLTVHGGRLGLVGAFRYLGPPIEAASFSGFWSGACCARASF